MSGHVMNPVRDIQQSSPLDTLVRKSSRRRQAPDQDLERPDLSTSQQVDPHGTNTLYDPTRTPPRQQQAQHLPSSPLLHTRFRSSTGTASSNTTFNTPLDKSFVSTDREAFYVDDDVSIYSSPTSPRKSTYMSYDSRRSEELDNYTSNITAMYRDSWQTNS